MAINLFVYGTEHQCVRVGFTGQRPLIYAVYSFNYETELPRIVGQSYRSITRDQYEWLRSHLQCDVTWKGGAVGLVPTCDDLECRSHNTRYKLFTSEADSASMMWEDRQV